MNSYRIGMVAACPFPAAFASAGLIRELSLALSRYGHEVHVITYHIGDPQFPTDDLHIHRIPKVPGYTKMSSGISLAKPMLDMMLACTLLRVSSRYHFDIIHAHNYEAPPAGYLARMKLDIPVIYHAHNTMFHELPTYFHNKALKFVARKTGQVLDRVIPRRADHIITVSADQTVYLESLGIPRHQMSLIPPCIAPELFTGGDGVSLRQSLGLGQSPIILYTGGLQPYQNCEILIDVLRHCLSVIPDIHLLILARSEPQWLQDLATAAQIADRVHFIQGRGLRFERDCLAAATVGIIPRINCIGFPVKLLNYAAAGIPVVCFKGIGKGFSDGVELLIAPSGDSKEMAARVIRLIQDSELRSSLIGAARQRILCSHNWELAIGQLQSIYDQTLSIKGTLKRQ